MKKSFPIFIIILLIFLATGCGSGSSNVLALDEFNIYENNKVVATSEEFSAHAFSVALNEEYGDYAGRDITTKRGIKLGSTSREVAEAYKGIPAFVSVTGFTEVSKEAPFDEVLEEKSQELSQNNYIVWYNTYVIDGKLCDTDTFTKLLEDNGIDTIEYLKNFEKYNEEFKITSYTLRFNISDNIVSEIQI
jgi:hypothetical protein